MAVLPSGGSVPPTRSPLRLVRDGLVRFIRSQRQASPMLRLQRMLDVCYVLSIGYKGYPQGPYFEEGIYLAPAPLPAAVQAAVVDQVRRAVLALGITDGPTHTELRLRGFASRRIVHRYSTEIETLPQVRNWKHLADRHVRILRRDMVGAWEVRRLA